MKKILSVIIAIMMVIGTMASVSATEVWDLEDLQDAINNGDGEIVLGGDIDLSAATTLPEAVDGVITLTSNVSLAETFTVAKGETLTIDLNGYTITAVDKNATGNYFAIDNYGTLTVKNGTITVTAVTDRQWNAASAVFQNRGGVLTIESGNYIHNGGTAMAYVVDNNANSYGDAKTIINGGVLTTTYTAIRNRMDTYGQNGGGNGVAILEINGGELTGNRNAVWGQVSSTGCKGTITITDGKFTTVEGEEAIRVGTDATGTIVTEISGGTFSSDVSAYVAEGFKLVKNADGTYSVQEAVATTLPAAVNGVITLTSDITLAETFTVAKGETLTIDLNGKTITYNSTTQGEAMITNNGNLTINDSGETGVINYNYTGAADGSYSKGNYTISNGGILTVNGGKITIANLSGHAKYPIDNNSTSGDAILTVNGGHLYNYNTSAIRQFCNSTTNKNSVTINGGVIEGYCAIWVQNPGSKTVNGSLSITGGEIKSTAKAWVNGTAELKDVSSAIYYTIAGEGGAWSESSAVSITGGTINENVSLAENAPAAITIGESATFNGYVTIPEEEETPVEGLPEASVKNLGAIKVGNNSGVYQFDGSYYNYGLVTGGKLTTETAPFELGVAMEFVAKDTAEEAAANAYGEYTTDFFIEIDGMADGSFVGNGCYLAGYYPSYGAWVRIPLDNFTIEEGVVYPVITSAGFDFSYVDICSSVQDFICGIYLTEDVLAANPELSVKLTLGLSETKEKAVNGDFITVDDYTYGVDDFGKIVANWNADTDAGYYIDNGAQLGLMRFLFSVGIDLENITESGIKYIRSVDNTTDINNAPGVEGLSNAFFGDITGIPYGTTGNYLAIAYVKTAENTYWSDVLTCSPNFTKHFTDYIAE